MAIDMYGTFIPDEVMFGAVISTDSKDFKNLRTRITDTCLDFKWMMGVAAYEMASKHSTGKFKIIGVKPIDTRWFAAPEDLRCATMLEF